MKARNIIGIAALLLVFSIVFNMALAAFENAYKQQIIAEAISQGKVVNSLTLVNTCK